MPLSCGLQARARDTSLRVSSISPGIVETEFLAVHSFGDEAAAKERCERCRLMTTVLSKASQHACRDCSQVASLHALILCCRQPSRRASAGSTLLRVKCMSIMIKVVCGGVLTECLHPCAGMRP